MNLTAARPRILVSADGKGLVSQAGAVLLVQAMRVIGLGRGLREAPGQWRTPPPVHDPGKIVASTMKLAADDVQTLAVPGCELEVRSGVVTGHSGCADSGRAAEAGRYKQQQGEGEQPVQRRVSGFSSSGCGHTVYGPADCPFSGHARSPPPRLGRLLSCDVLL